MPQRDVTDDQFAERGLDPLIHMCSTECADTCNDPNANACRRVARSALTQSKNQIRYRPSPQPPQNCEAGRLGPPPRETTTSRAASSSPSVQAGVSSTSLSDPAPPPTPPRGRGRCAAGPSAALAVAGRPVLPPATAPLLLRPAAPRARRAQLSSSARCVASGSACHSSSASRRASAEPEHGIRGRC